MPAFQPYWGKPAVRNDRGDGGNVGIIRSPLRATVLPDCGGREVNSRPYRDCGRGERATAPPMPILRKCSWTQVSECGRFLPGGSYAVAPSSNPLRGRFCSGRVPPMVQRTPRAGLGQHVIVVPTISQTNLVHIVLSALPGSTGWGSPEGTLGANPNLVDVADFAKKFPPGVRKEFDAGRKAEEGGDSAAAVKHFQAALRLAPDFYPARNGLGTQYMRKGDLQAAEREFRQVIAEDPNSTQAYFNLGNVLFLTNRNGEAKQTLEAGLRLPPSNALGHYLSGSVLTRLGDFKAAEEQLKTARVLNPKMPQVAISLATLYLQSGREHEAAAMFEAFLRQFPNDPMVPKVRAALTKMAKTSSP